MGLGFFTREQHEMPEGQGKVSGAYIKSKHHSDILI